MRNWQIKCEVSLRWLLCGWVAAHLFCEDGKTSHLARRAVSRRKFEVKVSYGLRITLCHFAVVDFWNENFRLNINVIKTEIALSSQSYLRYLIAFVVFSSINCFSLFISNFNCIAFLFSPFLIKLFFEKNFERCCICFVCRSGNWFYNCFAFCPFNNSPTISVNPFSWNSS
jgi:hypothetical protein